MKNNNTYRNEGKIISERYMNNNNTNPNDIGNEGFNDQRVNYFNSNSDKNVSYNLHDAKKRET